MDQNTTQNLNQNSPAFINLFTSKFIYILIFLVVVVLIVAFFGFQYIGSSNNSNTVEVSSVEKKEDDFSVIKNNPELNFALDLLNRGQSQESYSLFSKVDLNKIAEGGGTLRQTVLLYQNAALISFNQDEGVKEYFNFYNNQENTLINRAYALLMAQQNLIAHNNLTVFLPYLTEDEKKALDINDNKEINYKINQKIFSLYPFPITAARLAVYEIENLDKKNPDNRLKAKEVYDKYMFGFDQNLEYMKAGPGLRHLVANALSAKARASMLLEDYTLAAPEDTRKLYQEAINSARLYSPKGTLDFMFLNYLEHSVKTKSVTDQEIAFNYFLAEKKSRKIFEEVIKNLTNEKRMQENYPNIYFAYTKVPAFKNKILEITK